MKRNAVKTYVITQNMCLIKTNPLLGLFIQVKCMATVTTHIVLGLGTDDEERMLFMSVVAGSVCVFRVGI